MTAFWLNGSKQRCHVWLLESALKGEEMCPSTSPPATLWHDGRCFSSQAGPQGRKSCIEDDGRAKPKTNSHLETALDAWLSHLFLHAWEIKHYLIWGPSIELYFFYHSLQNLIWMDTCVYRLFMFPACICDIRMALCLMWHTTYKGDVGSLVISIILPNPTHILQNEFYPRYNIRKVISQTWKEIQILFF